MATAAGTDEQLLTILSEQWRDVVAAPHRDARLVQLTDEWRAVEWRSGGKTLLAALGLQYQEVPLCRALAWLLDPAGGHKMGRHVVDALMNSLDLPVEADAPVSVNVEEARADTRADIIVRVGDQTIIFEAKVLAGEQPEQADRIWRHWADENPTLVFLTRNGQPPYTAKKSVDVWKTRTWREMANIAREVAARPDLVPSYGASEFIETIGEL